ncbi:MAG: class I SAM-dependent methyltransferase, partial [Bacteroidota bacterium]
MNEIIENYIDTSFGEYRQAEFKFAQFDFNYKSCFPEDKNAKLLDIGIGRGEMLTCMKNWGYTNYFGIDISPSTVNFCKGLSLQCELVENTTAYLINKPNHFDLITLLDVLEHIPKSELIPFMKAVKKSLKKNGVLIIQVPNLQAPDGHLHMFNDLTHGTGFVEHSLTQLIIAAGFKEFYFQPFEEIIQKTFINFKRKIQRKVYWYLTKRLRWINTNLNPDILTPVFSAIITNND